MTTNHLRPPSEVGAGGQRVRDTLFFVFYSPLLFLSLFLFSSDLFFEKISNRRDGAGTDKTDTGNDGSADKTGGGKGYVL